MGFKIHKERLICAIAVLLAAAPSFAQSQSGQTDSLVRLMQAQSIELIDQGGVAYRKTIDATFLHNGTYLICDTALWNVDDKLIHCWGNVKLVQEETNLTSDKLDYIIDDNLAQFRGTVVQLKNKQGNILRTKNLDYNTRDSLATFVGGAAMRDEDGQVIESDSGNYESATKFFTFRGNVNMFTDSVFVKTTLLTYNADAEVADFKAPIDFWKDGNMLSSGLGWYNRKSDTFFFTKDVHTLTEKQEAWSDSLYFYKTPQNVLMLGHAQVQDTTRNVYGLANYIFYEDSVSRVTMRRDAAVAMRTEQEDKVDTLYVGADDLSYWVTKMCDIPESEVKVASARLTEILSDPVSTFRKRAAEEAAAAAEEARKERASSKGSTKRGVSDEFTEPTLAEPTLTEPTAATPQTDTSAVAGGGMDADSLAFADTMSVVVSAGPPDTTGIGFLSAVGKVRMFRKDMQVRCDSLSYCDLDSIARLYKSPIVWNDGNRQYTSDSLFVLVKDGGVDRASLMSNAFIITQEDSVCFDQIKGTDVMAYFDDDSQLCRFDALGGASALFFLEENETFATVNKVESKLLTANLKEGNLEKVYYFESPKNDAYPIVQLPEQDRRLKGFNWNPDDRPVSPKDITPLEIIPSERTRYEARPKAEFRQTDIYFPGYMEQVYKDIEASRERKAARQAEEELRPEDSLKVHEGAAFDSLIVSEGLPDLSADSLAVAEPARAADSLAAGAPSDTLAAAASTADPEELARQQKIQKRNDRKDALEQARALRIARRDARWAELDARDAEKAAAKAQKALERKRARTLKEALRKRAQDRKDEEKLEKYIQRYEKRKPIEETDNEQEEFEPAD